RRCRRHRARGPRGGSAGHDLRHGDVIARTVGTYLTDGSVDKIFLWDPAIAGQAQDELALRLIKGRKVGPGLDLHLLGYRNLKAIAGSPHALHGSAWIDVDRTNAAHFPF